METIRVNMAPCEEVQTIHASQNDGEARQWEFELHNNGELIDTSGITEQMFFKAYKGGTEQLLPENTSTPATSPFLGDIRYPQGLLTDQEFTYRQSPTESDGLAKITDIKGKTLKWNQQVSRTTFPKLHNENGLTITWKDSSTINISGTASSVSWIYIAPPSNMVANNHVYLITTNNKPSGVRFGVLHKGGALLYNTDDSFYYVYKNIYGIRAIIYRIIADTAFDFDAKTNMIDLTLMFGETEANRINALGQQGAYNYFRSLFPLSYYQYDGGSLLSFNGTGIKTANADETEEHTTNLPVSTYFPTGMKSAGTVYDELIPRKAITRIGAVDLGSLNWTYDSSVPRFYSTSISSVAAKPSNDNTMANILCSKYATSAVSASSGGIYASGTDKLIAIGTTGTLNVKDSSYTDATAFKESLQGSYLYYELATPTETSFTTASLVTENAEIPLSNEDGTLTGKCTEQLSENPGFFDAKIKLADSDGECYSNKLQLHVERSPQ